MSTRTLLRLAAAVSLFALAGCQGWNQAWNGPVSDEQRMGALMILQSGITQPRPYVTPFYEMRIPQSQTFNCYGCY